MKVIKILLFLSLCLTGLLDAKQLSFSKQKEDEQYRFKYQWLDHNDESQSMSFLLKKYALFQRFRMLRSYQSDFAQKTIIRAVKQRLTEVPLQEAQALFLQQNGKTVLQVKGSKDEYVSKAYKRVKEIEQEVTAQYFQKNYYQVFNTPEQVADIKIDHTRIANESVADFKAIKPVILEQVSIKDIRKVTDYVLSFVQSIPYATLESRVTSSGTGFNSPAKLLWENQGDCDSKVTLTATILRALMPRIPIVMIFIDQHAFIGIATPATAGEITIVYQGVNYLLGEPTGPGLYKLGKLAPDSELAINQGRYVVEAFIADDVL